MSDLYISWPEYHHKIKILAAQIHQSGWAFNQILCLAKGGLRVGDLLARIYDQPLAILAASSYGGANKQVRGSLNFARDLTMTTAHLGNRLLLVDDLVDSGHTLQEALAWLEQHYGADIDQVRTAVLWYKSKSVFVPDYYVDYLPENPWVHQPFEVFEQMLPADLAKQWQGKGKG